MLVDHEKDIKMEWSKIVKDRDSIKEQHVILEQSYALSEVRKVESEDMMLRVESECQEMKDKIVKLEEEERISSERRQRLEERYEKVSKELEAVIGEKVKVITLLKSQVSEKDEKIAGILKELHDCKGRELEVDRRIEEIRHKKSEDVRRVEELRSENRKAVETIKLLRREKSEADQAVEELRRGQIEDVTTIERLRGEISTLKKEKMSLHQVMNETGDNRSEEADDEDMERQRMLVSQASEVIGKLRHQLIAAAREKESLERTVKEMSRKLAEAEKKVEKSKNLGSRILALEDGFDNMMKAAGFMNPSKEVGDVIMQACRDSSKRGSNMMTPQVSMKKIKTEINAEATSTDRGNGSKNMEKSERVIESDDGTKSAVTENKELLQKFNNSLKRNRISVDEPQLKKQPRA